MGAGGREACAPPSNVIVITELAGWKYIQEVP